MKIKSYTILLIKGNVSMGDIGKENQILEVLGFIDDINKAGLFLMPNSNLLYKTIIAENVLDELDKLKIAIKLQCEKNNIGAFNFYLLDITESTIMTGAWHDGHY